jgi:hypothetical protein
MKLRVGLREIEVTKIAVDESLVQKYIGEFTEHELCFMVCVLLHCISINTNNNIKYVIYYIILKYIIMNCRLICGPSLTEISSLCNLHINRQ